MNGNALPVDFGKAADDYATHRQGYPDDFLARLSALGVGAPAQRILDIGCGTGLLSLALSRAGAVVTGLDPSIELLEKARAAAANDQSSAVFVEGRAEAIPFADSTFDVVTAATCWHWFDAARAAEEAARVLTQNGLLTIVAMEWHAPPGSVPAQTLALIEQFNASIPSSRITTFQYPRATADLVAAGFHSWEMFGFTTHQSYSREGWRGRVRASQGVGPTMATDTLARFDSALADMLELEFPQEPLAVSHRLFALVARRKN